MTDCYLLLSGILWLTISLSRRHALIVRCSGCHSRFLYAGLSSLHRLPLPLLLSSLSVRLRLGILPLDSPWGTTNLIGLHHGKRVLTRQRGANTRNLTVDLRPAKTIVSDIAIIDDSWH